MAAEIADRVDIDIPLAASCCALLPEGQDEHAYLRELVFKGLAERYGDPIPAEAVERAEMELGVINKMGYDAYFLIVWDFIKYAKDNASPSARPWSRRRSLVAYTLRITISIRSSTTCSSSASSPRARVDAGYRYRLLGPWP